MRCGRTNYKGMDEHTKDRISQAESNLLLNLCKVDTNDSDSAKLVDRIIGIIAYEISKYRDAHHSKLLGKVPCCNWNPDETQQSFLKVL